MFAFRAERRKDLNARYWFDCQCPACSRNWATLKDLPKDATLQYDHVKQLMAEGRVHEAIHNVIPLLSKRDQGSLTPSEEGIRAEDQLRSCVNSFGNVVLTSK